MRVVTFLLAVLACAGVVYNHLQLRDIRQQVEQIQVKLASQQKGSEPAGVLEAKQHLQRALRFISEGKLDEARAELERGSQAIADSARRNGNTQPSLQQLQQMVESARRELARFWSGKQETKP
ncbi:MAG: hypothetical protein C4335_06585 [Armatimonadota bacterium]